MIAMQKYIDAKLKDGKTPVRNNIEELFHWWMEDGVLPGQMNIFEDEGPG